MKGAEKAHKNPASKPDQMCLLPKKFRNFLMVSFKLRDFRFFTSLLTNSNSPNLIR
jgi:hypothetical protein